MMRENLSLWVCEPQRHRPVSAFAYTDQRLCYWLTENYYIWIATIKISFLLLVSVAVQAGSNLTLSETPKTGFLPLQPDKSAKHTGLILQ